MCVVNVWPRSCLQNTSEASFLVSPSEIIIWSDMIGWMTTATAANLPRATAAVITGWNAPHNDQVNACYLDGHVKSLQVVNWYTTIYNSLVLYNPAWK